MQTRNGQGARMVALAESRGEAGEPRKCLKCATVAAYTWDTAYGIQTACEACGWEYYFSLGD
jgi:hypothetical protein